MREAINNVTVEGTLSEIDLSYGSFQKDGSTIENISGTIKVRVPYKDRINEIPIHMYSNKLTKKGTQNPAYTSIEHVMNEYKSIAATGDEKEADCVRITRAKIAMNEYYSGEGRLVSYPRIQASFVNRIKREEMDPKATFEVDMVIGNMDYAKDAEGNDTEKYLIQGILPQWGGKVDIVPFTPSNEAVINEISQSWTSGDSVYASGRLNFTSTVETKEIKMGFGEPRTETHTVNISELVITGGDNNPYEGDNAFDADEIRAALSERQNRLSAMKANSGSKKKTPAKESNTSAAKGFDLGF